MCVSLPGKVLSVSGQTAEVDVSGCIRPVLLACDGAVPGSWVLVYSGVALTVVDAAFVEEMRGLLGVAFGGKEPDKV